MKSFEDGVDVPYGRAQVEDGAEVYLSLAERLYADRSLRGEARLTETTRVDVDAPPGAAVPTWHKVTSA